ncbi:MAG: QsdR family transcriptional regulator [Pseudonocardiales bacterium]
MSAASQSRPDAVTAFRLARRTFIQGERLDMQRLAADLGVDRTTLFRWVGNRDQLLAEILLSLGERTFADSVQRATGSGPQRVADALGEFVQALIDAPYFRGYLRRETERALRLLTTKASVVQHRMVELVERLLREEQDGGRLSHPLPLPDLAYLIMRISESFIYTDLITGDPPDAAKARTAIAALLGHHVTGGLPRRRRRQP